MSIGLVFWILMLLWLVFGLYQSWPGIASGSYAPLGHSLLLFMLFLMLGWRVFGPPIHA